MRVLLLFIAFISYSSTAFSETVSSTRDSLNGEFSFSEGNLLLPQIKTSYGQIDNFLRSGNEPQATNVLALSPELFIQTQGDGSLFQLQAQASHFNFSEFSGDDHYDYSLLSKFHLRFAESQKIFATGLIDDQYEYRGTGLSLGDASALTEGDRKRNQFVNVGYLYGHQDSMARAKFLVGYRDFSYLTREDITKPLAYSSSYLQGNFDYLITGKTYFSTKVQLEDFSHNSNMDLERKQYLALAGVKWQSTELTRLLFLFGYEKAQFDNSLFKSNNRFAWQVSVLWNPIQRLKLNFISGSEIKNSNKIEKSVNYANYYSVKLDYDFTDRFLLHISSKLMDDEFVGLDNLIKEDHISASMRLQYRWRHWLNAFVQYSYDNFDSTIIKDNYDLRMASFGFVVTF